MNDLKHPKKILRHEGRLSVAERDSLRNCVLNGDRPYPNLIAAGYAKENERTKDWYLTEEGYSQLRSWTIQNQQSIIHA